MGVYSITRVWGRVLRCPPVSTGPVAVEVPRLWVWGLGASWGATVGQRVNGQTKLEGTSQRVKKLHRHRLTTATAPVRHSHCKGRIQPTEWPLHRSPSASFNHGASYSSPPKESRSTTFLTTMSSTPRHSSAPASPPSSSLGLALASSHGACFLQCSGLATPSTS